VPGAGEVSHRPDEHTDPDLLALGPRALLEGTVKLAIPWQQPARPRLRWLNALHPGEAEAVLRDCCASPRWAARVAAGRPYPTPDALYVAAERAWWALDPSDWCDAFAAHSRIGERDPASPMSWGEQAGVHGARGGTLAALAEGNRRYEERFGQIFLVFATGKTADQMLRLLSERLGNDPETERLIAAGEQWKITRLRLERLMQ
jgi:OHCU decarboxylase